jgi:hypothetical protein
VVRHGARLGGLVSCVTNAYWARSDEIAHGKLAMLQRAGLVTLAVSVSRFHQRYVPLKRVKHALRAAQKLGLETALKGAIINSDLVAGGSRDQWKRELDADTVNVFPVLPYLREGASLAEKEYYREPGLPQQRCPKGIVCVEPDATAVSCCGPGVSAQFLSLGNVRHESLKLINLRFKKGGRQKILRRQGPIAFARGAISAGLGHLLRMEYAGPCDLCAHIASHPQLRQIAEAMSAAAEAKATSRLHTTDKQRLKPCREEAHHGNT